MVKLLATSQFSDIEEESENGSNRTSICECSENIIERLFGRILLDTIMKTFDTAKTGLRN